MSATTTQPAIPPALAARVLEDLDEPLLVLDTDGRCRHVTPAAAALLGRDVASLLGSLALDGVAGALGATLRRLVDRTAPGATVDGATVDGATLDGATLDAAVDDGEVAAVRAYASESGVVLRLQRRTTADRELIARLRESEARLWSLVDGAPIGIALADVAGRSTYQNARIGELVGLPLHEITRERWIALIDPADYAQLRASGERYTAGEVDEHVSEYRVRHADGTQRWVRTSVRRQRDASGAPIGTLSILDDITVVKRAQADLRANEERYRRLAQSTPAGMYFGDAAGRMLYSNPRYRAIWQMDETALLGFGWLARVHPDDRDAVLAGAAAALGEGREYGYEHRLVMDDGSVRWVSGHTVASRDAAGAITGALGIVDDVTARRAAAEAEKRALATADLQRARLEAVLDALPAGVLIADADGRVIRTTQQARAIWGGDIAALSIADYAHYRSRRRDSGEIVPPEERALVRALRGESTPPNELDIDRLDGGTATVLCAGAPVRDAEGRIIGGVIAMTDVSERVRLEAQLRHAQKMEAVGQLAGGIAHDFNNLLTVINGNVEFARDMLTADHPVQEDLAAVGQAAERARTLVRQLLAFSRKQVVRTRPIDVNDVVRGADSLLRRVLGDEIVFGTTLAPEPAVVHADAGQIEQVLMNLAVNARDAMLTPAHGHRGTGGTLTIGTDLVSLSRDDAPVWAPLAPGAYVRLTVADTGHGMDAITRARMFEPFFTTKAVGAGTGLGLATVYGIVAQSGGAVRVESAPGAGATFTILLPRLAGEATGESRSGTASLPQGRGTVLVVEDEAAVRITTRRVLERQ
ncbi:MAG: PAS domain S-box protein, partial [Gemmatirosa sp.]|nr:PAS domain S-box protein [Gemmatirosa sp.]